MVKHIVMWGIKDGADGMTRKEIAAKMRSQLEALKPVIQEIRAIEVGENFLNSPAAWDVALYTEFDSRADLEKYQVHPDHVKLKDFILSVTEKRAVVDYEI